MMTRGALAPGLLAAALLLLGGLPARAGITGVCPDGSMFVVKKAADIPCAQAKRVEPENLPPIRPSHLPRPYGWEVFQAQQDPNNPYNLVDQAQAIRESSRPPEDDAAPGTAPVAPRTPRTALPPVTAAPRAAQPLTLSSDDQRNLALIVELTQERLPARFARGPAGAPTLVVELAHSQAFEARLREHYAGDTLGPVVLFSVQATAPGAFHANFTFVQGHVAFHPSRDDARQLGVLAGELGPQAAGDGVLGYAVLPDDVDLSRPLDVYWNDRRITVSLL